MKGNVFVGKLPHRMSGLPWPVVEGALRFNVCSSSNQKISGHNLNALSPFFAGPIAVGLPESDGDASRLLVAMCIENFWQASKVWDGEFANGRPTEQWFDRRRAYWGDQTPHRRIKRGNKPNTDDPVGCWWRGKLLPYVEARCRMYIPMYADYVRDHPAFLALKALVDAGKDVLIIGYDGYPIDKPLETYLADPAVRFGHELVLAAMLRDEEPWRVLYPDIEREWNFPEPRRAGRGTKHARNN